jgi:hypothetical protein
VSNFRSPAVSGHGSRNLGYALLSGRLRLRLVRLRGAKRRHLDVVGPRASAHAIPLHQESCADALTLLNDMTSFPRDGPYWRIHAGETAGRWAKQLRKVFLPVRRIVCCEEFAMREPPNRVVQVRRFGGPDELEVVDAPLPTAGWGEVRVRVLASSVEYTDVVIRRHLYP